jgi:hypothetical protein
MVDHNLLGNHLQMFLQCGREVVVKMVPMLVYHHVVRVPVSKLRFDRSLAVCVEIILIYQSYFLTTSLTFISQDFSQSLPGPPPPPGCCLTVNVKQS